MLAWLLAACMLLGMPAALAEETAPPEPDFWQRIAQEILALSADEVLLQPAGAGSGVHGNAVNEDSEGSRFT